VSELGKFEFLHLVEKKIIRLYYVKIGSIYGIFGFSSIILYIFISDIIYNTIDTIDIVFFIVSVIILPIYIVLFCKIRKKIKQYDFLYDYVNYYICDEDFY